MAGDAVPFRGRAITISCTDPKRSERFYQGILAATPEPGDGYGCRWYRLGPLSINLMPNAAERSPATFPTHAMPILWLEVDDLGAAYERFVSHGVEIIQPPDGQFMVVADPDGLLIEVWKANAGE